jgi:hypothetical protein
MPDWMRNDKRLFQAGALLLPPDREFSAEGFIDGDAQFADLFKINNKI